MSFPRRVGIQIKIAIYKNMFKQELGFYLGNEKPDGFSGFVDENNLFLTVEIEAGITPDIGRELTFYIREKIRLLKIENLQQFDIFISNIIKEKNLPSGFSFSAGYLKGDIFYLKTINQGKIYIRRNNKLVLLIDSDKTASGFIKVDDVFVFTFSNFVRLLGGEEGLNNKFDHRPIPKIIDEITPELLTKDDQGTAALFLQLKKIEEQEKPIDNFFEVPKKLDLALNIKSYYLRFGQQKILTFITVFILGLILFWSVGIGVIRRKSESNQKKINLTKELISQKLSQAEEVSFLNMSSALSLIADSKDEANKIKKELGVKSYELSGIDKIIYDSENKILKKEEKKYTEFFDLTVDDKNAKGDKIYLNDDNLLVSDKSRGVLYEFSLTKKSLDKDQSIEIKKSSLIALFEDKKYFYVEGAGVYQMVDGKAKKVIENDKEWGKIIDLVVFNGNIYLLDQGKNEIWKYMSAELGFGGKNSYFQSDQSFNLSSVNSFSIDGSVYIAGDSIMFKFTSGLQDAFKTNLPDDNIDVNKIFTTKDLEKVYGWDKKRGTIYIMGKNGNYQEQVNSKILSTASDFVVHKEIIYVIQGSKIYKIE